MFSRPPPWITLSIGDVVSVTIFEAEPGAERAARPGNFVTLPNQVVTPTATSPRRMRVRSELSGARHPRCRKRSMKRSGAHVVSRTSSSGGRDGIGVQIKLINEA